MAEKNYTPMQKKAVEEEGKNMLVSASAGSGKTYVMIERVIRLILEGKADVDEILAVTYTKQAAEEMKQKLIKAVINEINSGRDAERFRHTLSDIPTASISTFHSFCSSLLKNYFYAVSLDPCFSVADETQAAKLRSRAMDGLFPDLYENGDEEFLYLVRIFRANRADEKLKEAVGALYTFACSERSVDEFLEKAGDGVTEKSFYRAKNELFGSYRAKISEIKRIALNVLSDAEDLGLEKYASALKSLLSVIETALNCKNYDELYSMAKLEIERTPVMRTDDESVIAVRDRLKGVKDLYGKVTDGILLSSPNGGDEKADLADYLKTARATKALCRLTQEFAARYAEEKNDEAVVDFSDLEHTAYKLLINNPEILAAVKSKYKYVFADEYQDVNAVQEAILNLISDGNAFMVGDVKQSIYAFRGCNPDIFAAKYEAFERGEGIPVSLDVNFRSSDGVLNAVNKIFVPLMKKDFGGVDYAANPMSGCGLYPEKYGGAYLHIVTDGDDEERSPRSGVYDILSEIENPPEDEAFREGLKVAEIITEELGKTIYDAKQKTERPVTPGDIAVLTRNSLGFTTEIVRQLVKSGIPVSSSAKNPIGDYPEIKLLTDILRLIDRFADDAPLIAALKSPLGDLSEEDIAKIHAEAPQNADKTSKYDKSKKATFFDNYLYYLSNGTDEALREKLIKFDEYISKIRLIAEFKSVSEVLTDILSETGLDLDILSYPSGELRLQRVERFIAEAEACGKGATVSQFLDRLKTSLSEVSVGSSDGDDSVTVMSMHASKGLEFPIVILAGLSKKFNADDTKKEILTDRVLGLALKLYDEENREVKSTLVRSAYKERASAGLIKEEMRIFYVAVTRAKDRLHLICQGKVEKDDRYTSPLFANKFSAFVKTIYFDDCEDNEVISSAFGQNDRKVVISEGRQSLTDKIASYLSFVYPHSDETVLPVKRAVTKLAEDLSAPAFIDGGDETPYYFDEKAQKRGIAYHAYLQYADLYDSDVYGETKRLLKAGKLTDEQEKLLDPEKLHAIISSGIFAELKGYDLYREQPFIVSLPADEVSTFASKSDLLVQGVIDLLAVKGNEAIIVDYKTSKKSAKDLKARYAEQLIIYKKAVEKTLGLSVKKTILFNISTIESVDVT